MSLRTASSSVSRRRKTDAARREIWERELRGGLDRLLAKNFAPAFTLQGKLLRTGGVLRHGANGHTRALQDYEKAKAAESGPSRCPTW